MGVIKIRIQLTEIQRNKLYKRKPSSWAVFSTGRYLYHVDNLYYHLPSQLGQLHGAVAVPTARYPSELKNWIMSEHPVSMAWMPKDRHLHTNGRCWHLLKLAWIKTEVKVDNFWTQHKHSLTFAQMLESRMGGNPIADSGVQSGKFFHQSFPNWKLSECSHAGVTQLS